MPAQVGLYAEFAPKELMSFLVSSQSYALGEAFELCAAAGLVREQVRATCSTHCLDMILLQQFTCLPSAGDAMSVCSGMLSANISAARSTAKTSPAQAWA